MGYQRYDFKQFIERVKDMDYPDIIDFAEQEASQVKRESYGAPDAVRARAEGSADYIEKIKKLLFFMRYGRKPHGVDKHDFQLYREVVERLVEKGQFKAEILNMFQ